VFMHIEVNGGKKYQKDYVRDIIEFSAEKLMSFNLRSKLYIVCNLERNLFKNTMNYGECTWDDDNIRPKDFEISVDSNLKLRNLLTTVAHEMVHVKQFAKGEMTDLIKTQEVRWLGKRFTHDNTDYWDRPWEIEAHGRETGLFVRWAETNRINKKWAMVSE